MREDELNEFKRTTGELNDAMVSISSMLNKHRKWMIYFGLRNDGSPVHFTINDPTWNFRELIEITCHRMAR